MNPGQIEHRMNRRYRSYRLVVALVVSLMASGGARAAAPLFELNGDPGSEFGHAVGVVGDVDGDGVRDLVVGAPGAGNGHGAAHVYSGRNGVALFRTADPAGVRYGHAVASVGDVDRDGVDDFAVGAPESSSNGMSWNGTVSVHSGRDGRVIRALSGESDGEKFGQAVAGVGDVDGDGYPDMAVGAHQASVGGMMANGRLSVFSGRDGHVLLRATGPSDYSGFGFAVAGVGDTNGDGRPDFAVGAPYFAVTAPSADPLSPASPLYAAGAVYVFSGADGSLLRAFTGGASYEYLGHAVAAPGDASGDGIADIVVGAPLSAAGGNWGGGAVYVYSGADGAIVRTLTGQSMYAMLGYAVAGGDINGDGLADIVAGAPMAGGNTGAAYVFSGGTGSVLAAHESQPGDYARLGNSVAVMGDMNGDGVAEYALGAPMAGSDLSGKVYLFSGIR